MSLTYTRVDKFHQTLGECSAGQFQTPLLLPLLITYHKREARSLESGTRLGIGAAGDTNSNDYYLLPIITFYLYITHVPRTSISIRFLSPLPGETG